MRTLTLILLSTLPALGAEVSTVTVADDYLPAFIAGVERGFLAEADRDEDGSISEAEALAWFRTRMNNTGVTFAIRFVLEAESSDLVDDLLPLELRTAIQAARDAEEALRLEREKAASSPSNGGGGDR